jgi:hypothetical protein
MKTILTAIAGALTCVMLSSSSQAAPRVAPNTLMSTLAQTCEEANVQARNMSKSENRLHLARAPDIKIRDDYVINVFFFDGDPVVKNVVAILEKGPEADEETPHITTICLNKTPHPPTTNKEGDIEFTAKLGENANIRFHLNKKAADAVHLERNRWKKNAQDSVAMLGPFKDGVTLVHPQPSQYPGCFDPTLVTVSGNNNEDLSFDFDHCLTSSKENVTYVYALYLDRRKHTGSWDTYEIDPQIINHAH